LNGFTLRIKHAGFKTYEDFRFHSFLFYRMAACPLRL
jgi:hypothetical protein